MTVLLRRIETRIGGPDIRAALDWTHPSISLGTELNQLNYGAGSTRCLADHLVMAYRRDGTKLLLHIEVQAYRDSRLAKRLLVHASAAHCARNQTPLRWSQLHTY